MVSNEVRRLRQELEELRVAHELQRGQNRALLYTVRLLLDNPSEAKAELRRNVDAGLEYGLSSDQDHRVTERGLHPLRDGVLAVLHEFLDE